MAKGPKTKTKTLSTMAKGLKTKKGSRTKSEAKSRVLKPVDPRSVNVQPQKIREYEAAMKRAVQVGAFPGCASVVWRHGKVIQAGCYGYADCEAKKPFRMDSLCRLYCMTKTYVATALMRVMEKGLLKLEDPVSKYLPVFADCKVLQGKKLVKLKGPILIKHLLVHQSGVGYAPDVGDKVTAPRDKAYAKLQNDASSGKLTDLKAFVDRLAKIPLAFQPGKCYEYGFSFDIIARILEVVTGNDVETVLNEYVFHPLGMHETFWGVPDNKLNKMAASYCGKSTWELIYGKKKGAKPIVTKTGLYRMDSKTAKTSNWRLGRHLKVKTGGGFMGYRGGGGLVSNVSDTAQFVKMLMSKGFAASGKPFLKAKTLKLCEMDRNKKAWGAGGACYIGNVGVFREGSKDVGMGGASCTYWHVDRKDDTATAWFTQNMDMPDPVPLGKGMDPKTADIYSTLHSAIIKGK